MSISAPVAVMSGDEVGEIELAPLRSLRPHPRNYREHPEDQVAHLVASIQEHGFYRNIVTARDGTILAGHGVAKAAARMGIETVPIRRLPLDPEEPSALRLLAGDNEISSLADVDDRALSNLLKEIKGADLSGLLGTGFDDLMLANLVFVTRTEDEIEDHNEASHWIGMPEYDAGEKPYKLVVNFRNKEDRARFGEAMGYNLTDRTMGIWYPPKPPEDVSSVYFEG